MNFGNVPIRINPNDRAEIVWARRIDPARAILTSIPLPESNHRHGDLVLHDGAPVGFRKYGGEDVPVFNELDLLASSTSGTFEVTIEAASIDDLVAFESACGDLGCATEDWSTIRMICRECSEGAPHAHPEPAIEGAHRFAVAAATPWIVEAAVAAWVAEDPRRTVKEMRVCVEPRVVRG
jgi:hypothetical protein